MDIGYSGRPAAELLNWRTLINAAPETPAETIEALDTYFKVFAQPPLKTNEAGKSVLEEHPCLKCGEILDGGLMSLLGFNKGGFEWGLVHGEGHCRNCRWPARAYHFIKDNDGKDLMTIRNVILQYHPDFVETRERATA